MEKEVGQEFESQQDFDRLCERLDPNGVSI